MLTAPLLDSSQPGAPVDRRPVAASAAMVAATITTGLSAGFFSTYQWSVIRGLARVDDATYVRAFQEINATVRTGWFAVVFFGAAAFGLAAVAAGWRARIRRPAVALVGAGLAMYGAGALAVTFAGNVPLNAELATMTDPAAFAAARAAFESSWNRLNLVRAVSSTAAFAVTLGGLITALVPERPGAHRRAGSASTGVRWLRDRW